MDQPIHDIMDEPTPEGDLDPMYIKWLTCESRCFGDKGDVEDITEG